MSSEQYNEERRINERDRLLSDFPYPDYEEWYEAAVKLLKGAPFEKKMYSKTYEGLTLQPMYMQQDVAELSYIHSFPGFAPYLRGGQVSGYKASAWNVSQEVSSGTPEECNKTLRYDLKNGQTAVHLILDTDSQQGFDPDNEHTQNVGTDGVSITTPEDLEKVFEDVRLTDYPIFIQAGTSAVTITAFLMTLARKKSIPLEHLRGSIGMDPLAMLACEGSLPYSRETAYQKMAGLTDWARQHIPLLRTILVQGTPYYNSGSSAVQEVAFVVATAVEYLREMQKMGLGVDEVAPRMQFVFSVGTDYFMEIAKLRAARLVWAKVVKAFRGNSDSQKMILHVRTSLRNKTIYDPYVNMLRTTIEAFAGVVGGCDSLHVGGFDEVFRSPDGFSRRIARNTQTILKEEAHIDEVIDPAGGSWYVEKLTDEFARSAWALFQEVEQRGGMANALQRGFPQEQIQQTTEARRTNLSTRKDVLVGTNMYADVTEARLESYETNAEALRKTRVADLRNYRKSRNMPNKSFVTESFSHILDRDRLDFMEKVIDAISHGATLGEIESNLRSQKEEITHIEPVKIYRDARIFEELRATTEAYMVKTGTRPKIFLANMGPIPQHKARSDFSIGFFEVGGFDMLTNKGFLTVDKAAEAAIASGAQVVVICSTDDTYPEIVPLLTRRIKIVKPDTVVILAGYPREHIEEFKTVGVDEFIHLRANVYEILVNLMRKLGIIRKT